MKDEWAQPTAVPDRDIFTKRGITPGGAVFEARGYVEYVGTPEQRAAIVYEACPILAPKGQRRNQDWVEKFTRSDGWIIPKHKVFEHLDDIRPQLRPRDPVEEKPWTHNHGDNFVDRRGEPMGERARADHLASKKWKDDHHYVGTTRTHTHVPKAKYGLAPLDSVVIVSADNDRLMWLDPDDEERWVQELQRRAEEIDDTAWFRTRAFQRKRRARRGLRDANEDWAWAWNEALRHWTGEHARLAEQARRQRREALGTPYEVADAVRLDMNPLCDWTQPGPGFFGIEGAIKGDAMLEWLHKNGWALKVIDVPGVSGWRAPELAMFAMTYMRSDPVFIVPDADWSENRQVLYHALNCQRYLEVVCGVEAYVAAPPVGFGDKPDDKGVDDYLGCYDGELDQMVVVEFGLDSEKFEDWCDEYRTWRNAQAGTSDRITTFDVSVANVVALTAGLEGVGIRSTATVSRLLHGHELTYDNAVALSEPKRRPVAPWADPFHSIFYQERQEFTESQRRRVAHAFDRLSKAKAGSAGAFTGTGEYFEAEWETGWRGGKRRRYRRAGRYDAKLELIELDRRLQLQRQRERTVAELLAERAEVAARARQAM